MPAAMHQTLTAVSETKHAVGVGLLITESAGDWKSQQTVEDIGLPDSSGLPRITAPPVGELEWQAPHSCVVAVAPLEELINRS